MTGPDQKFCSKVYQDAKCGTGWIYNATSNPDHTGCWGYHEEREKCDILNPKCRMFECSPTHITGFIRADAFHDPDLFELGSMTRQFKFDTDSEPSCQQDIVYYPSARGFRFSFALGSCGMKTRSIENDGLQYIQFEQKVALDNPRQNNFGLFLRNYFSPTLTFKCNYEASTTTVIVSVFKTVRII